MTDDDRRLLYVFERGKKKLMEGSSVEFTGSFSSQLTSFLKQTPALLFWMPKFMSSIFGVPAMTPIMA